MSITLNVGNVVSSVAGVNAVVSSDGSSLVLLDSLARSYNWNADGTLNYEQVTDGTNIWRKSYAYTGGVLQSETAWVKQ